MFTMCNATLNTRWDTVATAMPLNRTMSAWASWATSTTKQLNLSILSIEIQSMTTPASVCIYSFSNWLAVSVFPLEKLLLNIHQIWRHIHVTMLQYWAKFSNVLVHWSIRMIHAKNYETVSKFVKVTPRIPPRIPRLLFSRYVVFPLMHN